MMPVDLMSTIWSMYKRNKCHRRIFDLQRSLGNVLPVYIKWRMMEVVSIIFKCIGADEEKKGPTVLSR